MCHWREKTYASVRTVNLAGMDSLLAASSGTRCFWVGSSWSDPRVKPCFQASTAVPPGGWLPANVCGISGGCRILRCVPSDVCLPHQIWHVGHSCVLLIGKNPKNDQNQTGTHRRCVPGAAVGWWGLFGQYFRGIRVRRILLLASVFRVALLFVHDAHNSSIRHGRKTTCVDSAPKTVQRNPFCYIAGNLG